jgi:uncharacterized protein
LTVIVYESDKATFIKHNDYDDIEQIIHERFRAATGSHVGASELRAWKYSLNAMAKVLRDDEIPDDIGVGIEFILPQSLKRIDVTLAGRDLDDTKKAVIVELKQWERVTATQQDAIVTLGHNGQRHVHPSYQAWSYAEYLKGFNEAVYDGGIGLRPCAYLHNYVADGAIDAAQYASYFESAPLFLAGDADRQRLRDFIKQHVRRGRGVSILYDLENGKIRPSKALADAVVKLLRGNKEFTLLDDQKAVYEAALAACRHATPEHRRVLVVEGGPGTGKSVVALNLLAALKDGKNIKYVSKNAAPREVYAHKLGGHQNPHLINLFTGSGSFVKTPRGTFDALIVDEAHRLTEKGGFYGNEGDHQVREIINAANCAVFFLDEDQRVTLKDIGSKALIRQIAAEAGAVVEEYALLSQFRCAGSDGYLAWLDDALQIRETANKTLAGVPFDFRVFDDPEALHAAIELKNDGNKARVVAGYCWPWKSRKDAAAMDVVIGDYKRQWNRDVDGRLWIIAPTSIAQVGCIHTCQGLEVDYVGVIIGPDLVMDGDRVATKPRARDRHDKTMSGFVSMREQDRESAEALAEAVIKNTYRTLMTRGMKGCYVYATDPAVRQYLRARARRT